VNRGPGSFGGLALSGALRYGYAVSMAAQSEDQAPPEILYHYTSQSGLIGMLNSRSIWASKIHFLNDSREFTLALDLARQVLETRMRAGQPEGLHERLELLRDSIDQIRRLNICVCSFSELGDSLSQWRGYGGGKAGFSVGFSGEWFARLKETLGFSLSRCIYDPEIQQRLVREAVNEVLATDVPDDEPDYWDRDRGYEDPDRPRTFVVLRNAGRDFADRLAKLAPLLKDNSFADEKEWRLISRPISIYDLEHRPGESMMIPYYSLPIGTESEFDSISEIVVGPTPHPDLSADSVRSLTWAVGLTNRDSFRIRRTSIPFRNW
jgi:hypothetical protein